MALATAGVALLGLVLKLQSLRLFAVYLLMVAFSGLWQRKVLPLTNLRPFLIVHNFACCLASVCSLVGFTYCIWQSGSLYSRQTSLTLTGFFTLYWMTKVLELLDTVFMVLRHKVRQISFLHVYHHSSMLLLSDLGSSFYPWPGIAVFLAMNSFVHIVLYLYYGLTALFPDNPPTWKKQMTQIQIGQFFVGFVIAAFGLVVYLSSHGDTNSEAEGSQSDMGPVEEVSPEPSPLEECCHSPLFLREFKDISQVDVRNDFWPSDFEDEPEALIDECLEFDQASDIQSGIGDEDI